MDQDTGNFTSDAPPQRAGRISFTSHLIANILTPAPKGHDHTGHVTTSPTANSNLATSAVPHSTARPGNSPAQNSLAKDRLRTAYHGVEQLLQKVEKCLGGTPFRAPISALNVLIEVTNVCCHLPAAQHT